MGWTMAKQLHHLGKLSRPPASPDEAVLERVPNPHPDADYVVRFTCPEFTSLCPITGQPDFAHLVIDYVPRRWLVESKSLKLYLGSFRNHGGFHEDCTLAIGKRLVAAARAEVAAHRRLLVSARRHADRRLLADRRAARRPVAARPGRRALSRPGLAASARLDRRAAVAKEARADEADRRAELPHQQTSSASSRHEQSHSHR